MANRLTKQQYYLDRNIPLIAHTRPLDPLPPLSEHLIDPLPHIGQEVERVLDAQENMKNISLELANAHKIIHSLEEEL